MPFSSVLGASTVIKPGVVTTATRPSSPFVGQLIYDTTLLQTLAWNGSAWVVQTGGLVLIKTQTIGSAVSSVTVTDAFSSTYENYRIIVIANSASGNNDMAVTLGSTSTGYYAGSNYVTYGAGASSATNNNAASWSFMGAIFTFAAFLDFDLFQPNLASETLLTFRQLSATYAGTGGGYLNNSTAYTAFTITPNASNTLTGGTIYVYGYAKA